MVPLILQLSRLRELTESREHQQAANILQENNFRPTMALNRRTIRTNIAPTQKVRSPLFVVRLLQAFSSISDFLYYRVRSNCGPACLRPDMIFAVDWALRNDASIYLFLSLPLCLLLSFSLSVCASVALSPRLLRSVFLSPCCSLSVCSTLSVALSLPLCLP